MPGSCSLSLAKSRMKEERRKEREEGRGRARQTEEGEGGRREIQKYYHVSEVVKLAIRGNVIRASGPTPATDSRQEHKTPSTQWGRKIQAGGYK